MAKDKDVFIVQVNTLLADATERSKVGEQGLEIAKSRFSWDRIALQLEAYLTQVKS